MTSIALSTRWAHRTHAHLKLPVDTRTTFAAAIGRYKCRFLALSAPTFMPILTSGLWYRHACCRNACRVLQLFEGLALLHLLPL